MVYRAIALFIVLLIAPSSLLAQGVPASQARTPRLAKSRRAASAGALAPGTTITMQNWRDYRRFMPEGMVALFEGRYFWKMPPDVSMEVGPTVIHPLPRNYQAATEKYASQVRVIGLPDGGLTLKNYRGGLPFPNPQAPHRGWKILANLWFRYIPQLMVDTYGSGCSVNSSGQANCLSYTYVTRQFAYHTDATADPPVPKPDDKYFSEWFMMLEPEELKYTTTLSIRYADPTRPEDLYVFEPALRRYIRVSTAARCSPSLGTDATPEDYHFGLDTNITQMKVTYLGRRRILALIDASLPTTKFPQGYDMPLGWPTPAWGKWQLRDVYVISLSKVPTKASGYCYGKRVMYVDANDYAPLWEELYDSKMRIWKYEAVITHSIDVPGIGMVDSTGSYAQLMWDVQNKHATLSQDPALGRPFYVNQQAPKEYNDIMKYSTPSGLNLIMR